MYPPPFLYERPSSLTGALELLAEHGEAARPLAGGQSLIPLMKLRVVHPEVLVDLQDLPNGSTLQVDDRHIRFGPLTRHAQVERSPAIQRRAPLLASAMGQLADAQVRNLGTVAGSLAEADPGGDWGPLLLAMGGEVTCTSRTGERVVGHDELFVGYLASAVAEDELITEIRIVTPPAEGAGGAYLKLERRTGDFAVVSAAAQLTLAEDGTCRTIGVAMGGVGLVPLRARSVEDALVGTVLDDRGVEEAAATVGDLVRPISDGRGPDGYKRDMIRVYVRRAITLAAARARSAAGTGAPDPPSRHDTGR